MSKWKPWIAVADIHGDMQDPEVVSALWRFMADFKPETRILLGDLWDFRSLRRRASEEDKRDSIADDFVQGMHFLSKFRPTAFLLGNHDDRLWHWRDQGAGIVQDYAARAVSDIEETCGKIKCPILPYSVSDGVYQLGDVRFVHGFWAGKYAAREHALRYRRVVFGHCHSDTTWAEEAWPDRAISWGCPCVTFKEHDWNRARPQRLRYCQGWVYGVTDGEKTYVQQARRIGGGFRLPTEWKHY